MTYEAILQRTPRTTDAGNLEAAETFVSFLTFTIESDKPSFDQLTTAQQKYLYRLREKWKARAAGTDQRWNEYGSTPGRPVAKPKTRKSRRADPGEKDPLFQSLMKKYAQPVDE